MLRWFKIGLDNIRWWLLAKLTKGEKLKYLPKLALYLHLNRNWLVDFIIDRKGIFQPEIIEALEEEITKIQPELFIDVGAYIGQMGLYIKKHFPEIEVWLIEPQSILVKKIKSNAEVNNLKVDVFEMALSNFKTTWNVDEPRIPKDEYGKLNPGAINFTNNEKGSHTIDVTRLDELIHQQVAHRQFKSLLLKIDVENADWEVLQGLTGLFNVYEKISIIVELNFTQKPEFQGIFEKWIQEHQISISSLKMDCLQKPYQGDYLLRWNKN